MKTFVNKESDYSLHNTENFKKELDCHVNEIIQKLSELFIEYFKFIKENLTLKKTNFSRFIIIRGLETIINVFNNILFYTKNLDATYFHSQKAFYLYVEFVGQISEDEKMFLQLSSRDASIYVYKKTIFEINKDNKKKNLEISAFARTNFDIVNTYTDLYKTLLLKLINGDFFNDNHLSCLENIYSKLNNNLLHSSKAIILNQVIEQLYFHVECNEYFFYSCDLLVKKTNKNQVLLNDNKLSKFLSEELNDKLQEDYHKFINWLLN
jgi:hypothetical protein